MQNVQNAAEIQQRVINLVELYRTKVGKESLAAKELAENYKSQYENEVDFACSLHEQGIGGYVLDINIPKEAVDAIRVNEQLLGYFYKEVAKEEADLDVLSYFLADKYDSSILTAEETVFLKSHFSDMVNYIIQTPNNNLQAVEEDDRNDIELLPQEVLELVKERVAIPAGSKVYNPFTGFAQLACLYKDCSFFCEESYMSYFKRWNMFCDKLRETGYVENKVDENRLYAWMRVALYANKINAKIIEDSSIPQDYNAVVSYIPYIPSAIPNKTQGRMSDEPSDPDMINKIISAYQNLADGGKMILIIPTEYFWEKKVITSERGMKYALELEALWKQLIADNSLVEIIQLPSVMGKSFYGNEHCIVIVEKGYDSQDVIFVDARFASRNSYKSEFDNALDLDALKKTHLNHGCVLETGLRKFVRVPISDLKADFLLPEFFVLEKPAEKEHPVSLCEICSLSDIFIYNVNCDLPEDTPWVKKGDLSFNYKGELDVEGLQTANCPNNPKDWKYGTMDISRIVMGAIGENKPSAEVARISRYRNCRYIDGRKDAVLLYQSYGEVLFAVIRATGRAIAVSKDIHVFYPKDGIDALSLLAILRQPIVYRQLQTIEKFGLYGPNSHLSNILVPTDKRIIYDELHRMNTEKTINDTQKEKFSAMKTEYINEVRMRKHDMGQYIFELMNIEDLMRYYLENRETEKDFCLQIESLLDNFQSSLGELSMLLDNLSKEEQFGNPEDTSVDNYLSLLKSRYKAENFKIVYECDKQSIKKYLYKKNATNVFVDRVCQEVPDIVINTNCQEDNSVAFDANCDEESGVVIDANCDEESGVVIDANCDEESGVVINMECQEESIVIIDNSCQEDTYVSIDEHFNDQDDSVADETNNVDILYNDFANSKYYVPTLYISPNDLHRAVNNIIENARKHGFTDASKTNYIVRIRLSINEDDMFQIDFRNNGNPLPDGMNKMRYGIKGEKAGKTAGTGLGGSYVKSFVEHYGGDYDIFMEEGWTVVRICLPIK